MALCLSVCLSGTSRCSIKRDERIKLVVGTDASFDQTFLFRYMRKLFWNFFHYTSEFRHGISIVERVINLARERWTLRA